MKMNKKHLLLACSSLFVMASIASCSGDNGGESSSSIIPESSSSSTSKEDSSLHEVSDTGAPLLTSGTLHQISIVENARTFIKNENGVASSEYKIIYDDSSSNATKAASYFSAQINNASGFSLPLVKVSEFTDILSKKSKYIIIGCEELFDEAGKSMPKEELGISGYYISSYGNSLFFIAPHNEGYNMGVLRLLNAICGFDMVSEDTIVYSSSAATLPDIEIVEAPDSQWRNYTNYMTDATKYGLGFSENFEMMRVKRKDGKTGATVHNIFDYLPKETYADQKKYPDSYHPEWYSDDLSQLCYTAHGNSTSLNEMVDAVYEVLESTVDANPNASICSFTQADIATSCGCESCLNQKKKDGAVSGALIRFANKLDDKLQAHLKEEAEKNQTEKRTVYVCIFSYHASFEPPTTSPEVDPSLKCNDDVMVFTAPIYANFTKSFYEEENERYAQNIIDWNKYTKHIMSWVYETDYHHYMYPYNTYSSMMETYRFLKEHGTYAIYNEGQRNSNNVTCFGKLKEYLDSKAQIDVNASYDEYTDKFFKYYFDDASSIMRKYYEEMRAYETYLEDHTEEYGLNGGVYQEIGSDPAYWPKRLLLSWLDEMNEAEKAIAHYKTTEPEKYARLHKHILVETLFPRYALCDLHADTYSSSEILALRKAFKKDGDELGLMEHMEHHYITEKYEEWGIN